MYEVGEDKDLSGKATIELRRLFPEKKISKVTETNLSANQERAEMEKNKLTWKSEDFRAKNSKVARGSPVDPAKMIIELGPMEIRTFIIEFNQTSNRSFAA